MGNIVQIGHAFAGFTSAYDTFDKVFDQTIPADERVWSSSSHDPQLLEVQFDGLYEVTRVTARQISTDQTTANFQHGFLPREGNGRIGSYPIAPWSYANVGRSETDYGYSYDNDPVKYTLHNGWKLERESVGPMDVYLEKPVTARGMQLRMSGHGWFRCVDIRFYGHLIRPLTGQEGLAGQQRMSSGYKVFKAL